MRNDLICLGIDVGSVTLKLALLDDKNTLLYSSYEKHQCRPLPALLSALKNLRRQLSDLPPCTAAVTGSGRGYVSEMLDLPTVNEIVAQAVSASHFCPGVKTIIEIGGQDSKFIRLGADNDVDGATILTQQMNDICAAGTGAFIEQQAERMKLSLEEFGPKSLESGNPAFVAGRCAVFSKTDIVHLRQEGIAESDIAAGICNAVARNYLAQFVKGKRFDPPISFQGGLAANEGVVKAFKDMIRVPAEDFMVPVHFKEMGAIGTAMMSRKMNGQSHHSLDQMISVLEHCLKEKDSSEDLVSQLPRLIKNTQRLKASMQWAPDDIKEIYLGVDVGSTSTCFALIDNKGRLIADIYTLNKGSMIDSVNEGLKVTREVLGEENSKIPVAGVGVTGSGRYLISQYIGADIVKDEISAQAKAAVFMLPEVDTVFEIGGQDSKYIRIANGRVVDFEMNKVCAAGTGSFLQEQADKLGEGIYTFSDSAFKSRQPANLGSRCTVFMESDLVNYQQMGVAKDDLIAGLSYSIAKNYIEKVVAGKPIGKKILFLGGLAFNESVTSAFAQLLGRELLVPEHHENSAAIGMALTAMEETTDKNGYRSNFLGFEERQGKYEISSFQCQDCRNACRITKVTTSSSTFCYGGVCGKHEQRKKSSGLPDLFKEREDLLLSYASASGSNGGEKIGILRAQLFYEFFPLWSVFLQELGFEVVISDSTNAEIINRGLELTAIDNCFACKIVCGHMSDLQSKKVNRIFFPSVVEFERKVKDLERNYSCPHIQAIPFLAKAAFPALEIFSPVFVRGQDEQDWQKELKKLGKQLGKPEKLIKQAVQRADAAQIDFQKKCEQLGSRVLENLPPDQQVFAVMGKIYNVCDPGLNLNIAERLLNLNVVPIPFDCLPLSEQELPANYMDMVWSSGQDLLRAAKVILEKPRLYPVLITNFGCGPDSFTTKYLEELFRDRSFLTLEVDEHTSGVGFITRIEAFLNTLQQKGVSNFSVITRDFKPFMPSPALKKYNRLVYVPVGFDSYRPIASAFESIGIRTKLLPLHNEETERLGRRHTSGMECLPYIMHVGDAVRMTRDPEFSPDTAALYLPASDLGCRISLFPTSMRFVLRDLGYPDVPMIAPRISMEKDEMLSVFGVKFAKNLFRGMLSIELLGRLLTEKRPFETKVGECDRVYEEGVEALCSSLCNGGFWTALHTVIERFDQIEVDSSQKRPVIGLVGDDYTRGNCFANNDFIKEIEGMGGVVWNVPIWSSYLAFQMGMKPKKMLRKGRYLEFIFDSIKAAIGKVDIGRITRIFNGRLQCYPDPDFADIIGIGAKYLDEKSEPVALMALAHVIHLLDHGVDGVASLVGFQCMIHSIVSARLRNIYQEYDNLPVLQLTYDFQEKVHQKNRIEAFMYQVEHYKRARERVH